MADIAANVDLMKLLKDNTASKVTTLKYIVYMRIIRQGKLLLSTTYFETTKELAIMKVIMGVGSLPDVCCLMASWLELRPLVSQASGIRRHVGLKLAEFGAEVVAVSRAQSDLDALHKEVRRKVFAQISPVSKSEKGFESEVLRLFLSQLRSERKEIVGGVENKRLKKGIRRDLMFYPLDVFVRSSCNKKIFRRCIFSRAEYKVIKFG
ncbi:hypothetical protein CDAR_240651 [Caerostris darwini]|uniref:Uncharacterized protein n=1 Tax=Caerostris darwini TaxID=1538125 RepID=A0AAV4MG28_9ARAC|nr:hypothetical protein CDAR_240651 [Caerostris darwini]